MPYLERKGKPKLHYEVDDFTDPWRNAPILILQHGFGRSSRFWYSWIPYLSRFYKVVRPDLRGLGKSSTDFDLEKGITIDAFVEDLTNLLDQLGAKSVHYCGESLGGILGMVFAAQCPDRVRTLTLVGAPVYLNEETLKILKCGRPTWQDALRELGSNGWADAINSSARFPQETDPGLLRFFIEEMGKSKVEVLIVLSRFAEKANVTSYLSRIKAPVLGLYPFSGPFTSQGQEDLIQQHIRDIKIIHLASRFHTITNMVPASCAKHLLYFASQYDGVSCHE